MTLDYEIIGSGSAGNCVRVEDMLFDIGVPYKQIGEMLYDIRYIIITHRHSDHLHMQTAQQIQKRFPRISWIGNFDVGQRIPLNHLVGDETVIALKGRTLRSFPCVHDVPTHGFVIESKKGKLIYATDTHSLEHAPKEKYDYLFIESNHDEKKLEMVRDQASKYGYDAWKGGMRHLSTQKSKAFYYIHRSSPDAPWVELHKSERFY